MDKKPGMSVLIGKKFLIGIGVMILESTDQPYLQLVQDQFYNAIVFLLFQ